VPSDSYPDPRLVVLVTATRATGKPSQQVLATTVGTIVRLLEACSSYNPV
jgi:hypothetical protein